MRNRNMKEQIMVSTPIGAVKGTRVLDFSIVSNWETGRKYVYVYNETTEVGRILMRNGYIKVHYIKKLKRHIFDLVVVGSVNIDHCVNEYNSILNNIRTRLGGNL